VEEREVKRIRGKEEGQGWGKTWSRGRAPHGCRNRSRNPGPRLRTSGYQPARGSSFTCSSSRDSPPTPTCICAGPVRLYARIPPIITCAQSTTLPRTPSRPQPGYRSRSRCAPSNSSLVRKLNLIYVRLWCRYLS
jgi:hypothetical protein